LQSFPFDRIKVDRSFVQELPTSQESSAIVRAVIGLGQGLGIPVVAEGVETQAQFDMLRGAGCAEAQGYLVGRPLNIAAYCRMTHPPCRAPSSTRPGRDGRTVMEYLEG
jgi:EAL domain-containing protein (putative c-di-GMP-specific phosphodiesterase class I)